MTHHPRVAMTFIAREITELERLDISVVPVSMNACSEADVAMPGGREERDRTFYIKQAGALRALVVVLALMAKRPLGFARVAARAARSGGTDPQTVIWRLFHLVEGALVADHCRTRGIRHLHAHFGQTPASIAWFATECGNLVERGQWTWSFTIHGFQDFVDEHEARLDLKAVSASFVICVSDFTRSQLMRITSPSQWGKFHIVRCGLDLAAIPYRSVDPGNRPPRIVMVARISPEKGHLVLLDAVRRLDERGVSLTVELIGGGEFTDELRAEAAGTGVAHLIRFLGELEPAAVVERLAAADIFCLPSFAEGLPVSMMEAMAVGVPVVSTYIGGIPELALAEITALTVPAGNSGALAGALQRLIEDEELRARLATAARQEIEFHYSAGDNVARLAELFSETRGWITDR
jgi:glycosyltransferase involved in cell wall biosynthesis